MNTDLPAATAEEIVQLQQWTCLVNDHAGEQHCFLQHKLTPHVGNYYTNLRESDGDGYRAEKNSKITSQLSGRVQRNPIEGLP